MVKLNGIPFRSTKRDVVNFFEPEFMIEAQQVYITMGRDGRPAGSALVKMLSIRSTIHHLWILILIFVGALALALLCATSS